MNLNSRKPRELPREEQIEGLLQRAWSELLSELHSQGEKTTKWNVETAIDYLLTYAETQDEFRKLFPKGADKEFDAIAEKFVREEL